MNRYEKQFLVNRHLCHVRPMNRMKNVLRWGNNVSRAFVNFDVFAFESLLSVVPERLKRLFERYKKLTGQTIAYRTFSRKVTDLYQEGSIHSEIVVVGSCRQTMITKLVKN